MNSTIKSSVEIAAGRAVADVASTSVTLGGENALEATAWRSMSGTADVDAHVDLGHAGTLEDGLVAAADAAAAKAMLEDARRAFDAMGAERIDKVGANCDRSRLW